MTLRAILALVLALSAGPVMAQGTKPKSTPAPAAAPAAPAAPAVGGDPVVARVNGFELHRSDVEEAARGLPPQARQQPPDKIYAALLDQMIATTLVAQAARKAKVQDEPRAKRHLTLITDQVMAQLYVDKIVLAGMNEQKLKAKYDKLMKDAPPREEVNARHILLANEADAKAAIEELKKGADFAKLANQKSTDPAGKTSGGDLGWFTKDQMVPEFADAAFNLKKGEITDQPVKTQFGWHVIKLEDRRQAKPPTFDQVKPQLADEVARDLVGEKMKELKTAARIEVFNADGSKPGAAPTPAPAPAAPTVAPDAPTLAPGTAPPTLAPETAPPTLAPATKP
jgi:peptidyl-prolyl cis-trans isomerase C